jgi:hypothetical protein
MVKNMPYGSSGVQSFAQSVTRITLQIMSGSLTSSNVRLSPAVPVHDT